jgi:hypothetical protein
MNARQSAMHQTHLTALGARASRMRLPRLVLAVTSFIELAAFAFGPPPIWGTFSFRATILIKRCSNTCDLISAAAACLLEPGVGKMQRNVLTV